MKTQNAERSALTAVVLFSAGLASSLELATSTEHEFRTAVVRYSVLDLTQPDGARAVYERIKTAARQACGATNIEDLTTFAHYHECYEHAVANAVARVQSIRVSELHRNETQHATRS
jgi:UrcA family protein